MNTDPFIICGGGIGGLAAALGLANRGYAVTVLEKASQFGEIGAGIQLGPNAFRCFDNLGIGEQARAKAVFIDQLRLMDAMSGEEITHIPLGRSFRQRYGNPYAVVHRGDLSGVLIRACESHELVTLRAASEVKNFQQSNDDVTVVLADGTTLSGRGLIGADGLWSTLRQQVVEDGPPRVSGHTTYRSVIPLEQMPESLRWNAATLWAGPHCHIVHYPLSDWRMFNLVVTYHNHAPHPVVGEPVDHEEVISGFEHIHSLPRQIIDSGTEWKKWVLCDREPVTNWQDNRVVLLGDAAHPMLQYMAQGACMAVEDAVCLADQVGLKNGKVVSAFRDYQSARIKRTSRVVLASRAMGDHVYHPEGAHALVRNHVLGGWSEQEFYHRLDWLYGEE